jgi:hypothetical protein
VSAGADKKKPKGGTKKLPPTPVDHIIRTTLSTLRAVASSVESINLEAIAGDEISKATLTEIKKTTNEIRRTVTRLLGVF